MRRNVLAAMKRSILVRARELVSQGWIRGEAARDGSYCMVGAIRVALEQDGVPSDQAISGAWLFYAPQLRPFTEQYNPSVFNDYHAKGVEDVLEAFDKAIASLEAEA